MAGGPGERMSWVTAQELAEELHCSVSVLYEMARWRGAPVQAVGKRGVRFDRERWVEWASQLHAERVRAERVRSQERVRAALARAERW